MVFVNFLHIIDNSICVYPNYKQDLLNVPSNEVIKQLEGEFDKLFIQHGQDRRIILLLDLTQIDINNLGIGIPSLKTIIQYLQTSHPDKLNRVVIYNYTEKVKFVIALLKKFVKPEISAKIIVDRNYQKFINVLLSKKRNFKSSNNIELQR